MIGSVHGCVSCPVVVKPWEPQSLSRPQHPHPSQLHSHQSLHPYSISQHRSSSVHPWPLQSQHAPGDKTRSSSLSPQRLARAQVHRRHSSDEKKITAGDHSSYVQSTNGSPKKTESLNGSPKKLGPVFKSRQTFAEQYERLLDDKDSELTDVINISSQNTFQLRKKESHWDAHHSESYIRASKLGLSSSNPDVQNVGHAHHQSPKHTCDKGTPYVRKTVPLVPRESTPPLAQYPDGSKFKSHSHQLSRMGFSPPTPLPSIQAKAAAGTAGKSSHPLPLTILPPYSSARPATKVLPSLSSPALQALRKRMTPPPPPSLFQARGKKRHSLEQGNESIDFLMLRNLDDPFQYIKLGGNEDITLHGGNGDSPNGEKEDATLHGRKEDHVLYSGKGSPTFRGEKGRHSRRGGKGGSTSHERKGDASLHRGKKSTAPYGGKEDLGHGSLTAVQGISCETDSKKHKPSENLDSAYKFESSKNASQGTKCSVNSPPQSQPNAGTTPSDAEGSDWTLGQPVVPPEVDALTTAAAAGDMVKVKALLTDGVDVNAVNSFGRTAIQVMTLNNTDLAEVLLKRGAKPNIQDVSKRAESSTFRTIAHDVAESGYTDMLRCLLRHGVDVSLRDKWGNTPLHLAAKGGHLAAVRLLRRGTSLNQQNLQGKTPSMLLKESGNAAAKQWLDMFQTTVSRLQTLSVLALRLRLGPAGLQQWRHRTNNKLWPQVMLQSRGCQLHPATSASTLLSCKHSPGSRSLAPRGRSNGNSHPLVPGMSGSKQMTDFLTLRDLIPRRPSMGENTSLEVHNTSSGQSNDDVSLPGARATSSLASDTGSLFETNLSSIDASQSADDVSLSSPDS